jgi:Xaa-Pro aminopeptidase
MSFEPVGFILVLLYQENWLNDYHTKCRDVVGAELKRQGKKDAYDWLMRETQSIG